MTTNYKVIDIGANLCDLMYTGVYHDKQKHTADLHIVLQRAQQHNINTIILTSGNLTDIQHNIQLIQQYQSQTDIKLYTTAGIHPTRANEYGTIEQTQQHCITQLQQYFKQYSHIICAIGECGLDYDRLQFSSMEQQKSAFDAQLQLAHTLHKPLFLHNRNTNTDFINIIEQYKDTVHTVGGVVHSYTGTVEDMLTLCNTYGLYIGVNGCSLKTDENIDVVKQIPLNKILIETDAPWCGVKKSHTSYQYIKTHFTTVKAEKYKADNNDTVLVKDRNEPCTLIQILEILAAIRSTSMDTIAETCYNNTKTLFKI